LEEDWEKTLEEARERWAAGEPNRSRKVSFL
jgi:hypothetical protein